MKTLHSTAIIAALGLALLVGCSDQEEPVPEQTAAAGQIEYVAAMTGITWGGCESGVREAFMTITGVTEVKFEAADPPADPDAPQPKGARKVIVVTDQEGLTKDDAVKALGKKATRYVVQSWTGPAGEG